MTAKKTWYDNGLAFECQGCGQCCSGPAEGYVWVSNDEMAALARSLGLSVSQFKKKYATRVVTRYTLIEKQPSKDCIFLTATSQGKKGCSVYSLRPLQCRTWPFWRENLSSRWAWERAGENCPGINHGLWHTRQRIEAIQRGDFAGAEDPINIWQAASHWLLNNRDNADCINALTEFYDTLDSQIAATGAQCDNCGRCCNFERFGHRLYATTLEMLFFLTGPAKLNEKAHSSRNFANRSPSKKALANGRCPYQLNDGCAMRMHRPTGCRIFYCKGLPTEFQNELTENALASLRSLHEEFGAIYYYANLTDWLNQLPDQK